jgi:uncharacterized protein YbaR (Trm112 family)
MYTRLLSFLCCPYCQGSPEVFPHATAAAGSPEQITEGLLSSNRYPPTNRREAARALTGIYGAPYAYRHSYAEAAGRCEAAGGARARPRNDDRRGFGVRPPGAGGENGNQRPGSKGEQASSPGSRATPAASVQGGQL